MPIYTYQCENCGVRFDHQQSFSDRNLTRCPECNKNALHRIYQPVGIVFKGSGFYVTDNRSAKSATRAIPASDAKEKPDSKSETKSEPAKTTKTEPKTVNKD